MAGQRIELEVLAHDRRQAVDLSAEIRGAGNHVHADRWRQRQHAPRSAATTAPICSRDTPAGITNRSPLPSVTSMAGVTGASGTTATGTNAGLGRRLDGARPIF
jgi:hypothetical protein